MDSLSSGYGYSFHHGLARQEQTETVGTNSGLEQTARQEQNLDTEADLQHLARHISRNQAVDDSSLTRKQTEASEYTDVSNNPFRVEKESVLDPESSNFRAKAWVRSMMKYLETEDAKHLDRQAGISYKGLTVQGNAVDSDYQRTVGNVLIGVLGTIKGLLGISKPNKFNILEDFEGLILPGEMLVVLGPPGSGCSTFLKTISGETHGFEVQKSSSMNYQGISARHMNTRYRGEAIYTAEVDVHFPNMTVGDTLYFAARARSPRNIPGGLTPKEFGEIMRNVSMATFGITHTKNTRVGNDFVRGVSGGERKRVTIAEASLGGANIQCWDNSTRGLDSANAIEFCKTLRLGAQYYNTTSLVAIYQAPQAAYDLFDKVLLLYEGRQVYFGPTTEAKDYFIRLGLSCPERQTTADFLTAVTSPLERKYRDGFGDKAPKTAAEFANAWQASKERHALLTTIEQFDKEYPIGGESSRQFEASRSHQKSKGQSTKSPYTLSYQGQIKLCLWRGFRRLAGDPSVTVTQIFGNSIMALIVGSVFYNLQPTTYSFFQRGALLFFAILLNAFGSALEILTLYAQRPIVEKHARYAFYHPSAEAFASMLTDMPYKIVNAIVFNTTLYFLSNLRREPGPFFFFLLVSFFLTMSMSMLFRTIASVSRTLSQAMTPAALLILAIVMFTGFAIPTTYMLGWSRWINYINPVAYGFEALMVNEFHNRNFVCSTLVPSYGSLADGSQVCSTVGSVAGQNYVNGDRYLAESFQYYWGNRWRNFGIIIAFMFGLLATYLMAAEWIGSKKSKGEVLVFRRGQKPGVLRNSFINSNDLEHAKDSAKRVSPQPSSTDVSAVVVRQTAVFHWSNVCFDVKIKGENRRILDNVDGWVKPGTLTALMGVSGAGKTSLLDTLATRVTTGVISGDMRVDGRPCDDSFQRRTGYVQQQDLHLATSTVREALSFSALLRQSAKIPRAEKFAYVDEVIKLLDMQDYADAVVGVPGEGLNVEQRKRLTIGVELAAKPDLLLFLDEPTSGLDSQTSWAICDLMEKLTKAGQAILCTVHQPSAMLFQRFDRLLFLAKGGRTIYFGDVGHNSNKLVSYFERNGASTCPPQGNPAEWMLEVIGAAPGTHSDTDWHSVWKDSPEFREVKDELRSLENEPKEKSTITSEASSENSKEFASPFMTQLAVVTRRVFEQYWRTPSYIFAKLSLCTMSGLFIGFVFFRAENTQQGLQNQLFAIFLLFNIFGQLTQQIMPHFVSQRALYEARERPSKTYSWVTFMVSNILVELPWNALGGLLIFFCLYYPIGLFRNAIPYDQVHERGALFFLFTLQFMLFTSTYTTMFIAGIPDAETAGNLANLGFALTLIFCGVLASPGQFPHFWIWLYRISPFTYLVDGMLAVGIANNEVTCAANEFLRFDPPAGQDCGTYLARTIAATGEGYVLDPSATSNCGFCQLSSTNAFLSGVNISYDRRWFNFGILWVFIVFNIFAAVAIYWLARVPKKPKVKRTAKGRKADDATSSKEGQR